MNIDSVKTLMLVKKDQSLFLLNKHSSEILMVGGIIGVLTSTVLACKATLKVKPILDQTKATNEVIENMYNAVVYDKVVLPDGAEYTKEDYIHDHAVNAFTTFVELAKLYGPSVVIGLISIGMLVGSNRILNKRNAALITAYKLIDQSYKAYRKRVREELGDEVDDYLRYRKKYDGPIKLVDEKGKPIKFDSLEVDLPGERWEERDTLGIPSVYSVFFDDSSPQWRQTNELNEFFLKAQQNFANDLLNSRGHVFLNEVYDMIGVPRTKEGALVGWVKNSDLEGYVGDGFIDFDIYNPYNSTNRDYINNYQQDALFLDFNVDGVIFDLI